MLDRRSFLFAPLLASGALAQRGERPPNIVFIMADDLGLGDLGCYGQKIIRTPNIDRLAREGIRFTQAYAGCTVCAPSRSVLMTGLHMGHTSIRANAGGQSLEAKDVTVAQLLKQAGYKTGGFTEFVPLPFVHLNAPVYLAGIARPGPTIQENTVVHAMARLLLHNRIDHIQTSWVKLGERGTQEMLRAGADDLGGTLMEETISRMAGSMHGSRMSVDQLEAVVTGIGRTPRQRTTTYGAPSVERLEAARAVVLPGKVVEPIAPSRLTGA